MGTCYYLHRPDSGTLYDLGKAWELRFVFGCTSRRELHTILAEDAELLADVIEMVTFEHETTIGDKTIRGFGYPDTPEDRAYVRWYALDIVRWSDGRPFELIDDSSGTYEELVFDDPAWQDGRKPRVTGSRFRDAKLPAAL